MKLYRLCFFATLALLTTHLFAAPKRVFILCPAASNQVFHFANGTAYASTKIPGTQQTIYMQGDSSSKSVQQFSGAEFVGGMLACAYQGDQDQFGVMNYYMSGDLENCHFLSTNDLNTICQGSLEDCALVCEYLGR